jgi:hypothetical protein
VIRINSLSLDRFDHLGVRVPDAQQPIEASFDGDEDVLSWRSSAHAALPK